jgi:hypothetical protein
VALVRDAVERPVGCLDSPLLNDERCARRGAASKVKRGEQSYDRPALVEPLVLETLEL